MGRLALRYTKGKLMTESDKIMITQFIKKLVSFLVDSLETIAFVGSIYIVVYLYFFFPTQVVGASMEPTFDSGDKVIISRISYKLHTPERSDVIAFKSPRNPDIDYFKRVIGLPGDKLLFKNKRIYLNGNLLDESYISAFTNVWQNGFVKEGEEVIVPDEYIFVMGDNRPRSSDSREFGFIPVTSIEGKAIFRFFPPDKVGIIEL